MKLGKTALALGTGLALTGCNDMLEQETNYLVLKVISEKHEKPYMDESYNFVGEKANGERLTVDFTPRDPISLVDLNAKIDPGKTVVIEYAGTLPENIPVLRTTTNAVFSVLDR